MLLKVKKCIAFILNYMTPAGSPVVFVNHTACCSLALTWHIAILVLMDPTDILCRTLAYPISTATSTSHPCSLSMRMTSCGELGRCQKLLWGSVHRHAQHLYPRPEAPTPGHRSRHCQDRVLSSCPAYPKCYCPTVQPEPSLSCRIASWQEQWEGVQVAGLATCWTLLTCQPCHQGDSWSWGSRHKCHTALLRVHRQCSS